MMMAPSMTWLSSTVRADASMGIPHHPVDEGQQAGQRGSVAQQPEIGLDVDEQIEDEDDVVDADPEEPQAAEEKQAALCSQVAPGQQSDAQQAGRGAEQNADGVHHSSSFLKRKARR